MGSDYFLNCNRHSHCLSIPTVQAINGVHKLRAPQSNQLYLKHHGACWVRPSEPAPLPILRRRQADNYWPPQFLSAHADAAMMLLRELKVPETMHRTPRMMTTQLRTRLVIGS